MSRTIRCLTGKSHIEHRVEHIQSREAVIAAPHREVRGNTGILMLPSAPPVNNKMIGRPLTTNSVNGTQSDAMRVYLEVTWPVYKTVPLPGSEKLARELNELKLRNDLVCVANGKLCIHGLFGYENRVSDADRYKIVNCGQEIAIEDHRAAADGSDLSTNPYIDRPIRLESREPTLVIVLESPHRDEYGVSVGTPIAPARGATGARIHKYLRYVLNNCSQVKRLLSSRAPVRVIISNPIPFQTSAYAIHGGRLNDPARLRNFVWRELWRLEACNSGRSEYVFQQEFRRRLDSYNPIAIVNACTSGGGRRDKVASVLQDWCDRCGQSVQLYEAAHPSTWKCSTTLNV